MERSILYAAVWRWHFYAGLMTLPFLALLSVTGGLYLFKDEIHDWRYDSLLQVEPTNGTTLRPSAIVASAVGASGDRPTGYVPPVAPTRSARVVVEADDGVSRYVFVDPGNGRVLGELAGGEFGNLPLMSFVRRLHSLEVLGWPGNRLVEIAAGWAVILAATGIFLWWPRGRGGGVLSVRRNAGRRTLWRDVHAVTGVIAAGLIVFMALTGLPWSGVWGAGLKAAIDRAELGYPDGFWYPVAHSTPSLHDTPVPAPWTIADLPLPNSRSHAGAPLEIDAVVAIFDRAGMPPGYSVSYPHGAEGVWSASVIPERVAETRTMHLDQFSGEVLFDMRYGDLGAAAQAIEWGISVHTGRQFGRVNQWLMLLVCLAILTMCISALCMWWIRRPRGSLGAPRLPAGRRSPRGLLMMLIGGGLLFPLVGLSIIAFIAIDTLLTRQRYST